MDKKLLRELKGSMLTKECARVMRSMLIGDDFWPFCARFRVRFFLSLKRVHGAYLGGFGRYLLTQIEAQLSMPTGVKNKIS